MHRSRVETSEDFGHAREAVLERPGPVHSSRFVVGGVSVQLAGDYEVDTDLVPSLRQFSVRTGVSDIHIQVERVAGLRRSFERQLFDSGSIWQLYEDEGGFQFDFSARIFGEEPYKRLLVDERFRWATLQLNARAFVGNSCMVAPLDYPLDELLIMHRLTQEKAIELWNRCAKTHDTVQGCEPLTFSGMAYCVELKFQVEQNAFAVLAQFTEIFSQSVDALFDGRQCGEQWPQFSQIAPNVLFE